MFPFLDRSECFVWFCGHSGFENQGVEFDGPEGLLFCTGGLRNG